MNLPAFIKQTALRTGAIFLVKAIGLVVRIPLFRLLGSEGTGIYQIVYSIYGFALTLISGGFPTSLALMTAKDRRRGWQFLKGSVMPFFILGAVSAMLFYALAPQIAHVLGDRSLTFPIRCLTPALLIVPLLQLYRGFLQGIELYGYVSASELIEQTVRAGTMLLLVVVWMKYGIHAAAGGAVFGAFTGACTALWFLWILRYSKNFVLAIDKGTHANSIRWLILGPGIFLFMKSSFSIALTRLIVPASDFLDALIIPSRLQASGLSQSKAIAVFGEISGMASTVVYMPTILTGALSYTIASKLTADWQNKKNKDFAERSNLSLKIGLFWGIGSMLVLLFHADELSLLIFGNIGAAEAIRYMSFAPLIAGMREITTTILWASDQKRAPLVGLLMGLIGSATASYHLTAIPGFGYAGAAISVLVLELISFTWNAIVLQKRCRGAFPAVTFWMSSIILGVVVFLHAPFELFLKHIGIQSAIVRSLGVVFLLLVCISLYIYLRIKGNRNGGENR